MITYSKPFSKTLCIVSSLAFCHLANGTTETSADSENRVKPISLTEELVVTATKTSRSPFETLATVSVIDAAEIARLQITELGELLELQAGTDIIRSGSPGSVTSLQTRGTNSDHTLILINGQRLNSATLGSTQFQLIDPSVIERVEFVKGSRSALYGSDAIAGVINITTKQGLNEQGSIFASEVGSNNTLKTTFSTSNAFEKFRYGFSLSYLDTEGFDSLEDDTAFNEDDDGFENVNTNLSATYRFDNKLELSFNHFQSDAENHFDSKWTPETQPFHKNTLSVTGLNLNWALDDLYSLSINTSRSIDDTKSRNRQNPGITDSFFETERSSAYIQNDFYLHKNFTTTVGFDYYDEEVTTSSDLQENVRSNAAVFAQLEGTVGKFDFLAGYRADSNNSFGDQNSGSFALGFKPTEHHKIYASWTEGFKAPTLNDLYWPADAFSAGNPDILPEVSTNYEAGIRGHYENLIWELAVFNNEVENLIDWAPGEDSIWRPSNIATAKFEGGEISTSTSLGPININANLSRVEPTNAETGERLENRARHKFALDLNYQIAQFNYGLTFKRQGDRKVLGGKLDAYNLLGIYAHYKHSDQLSLSARVNNMTDEEYQLNEGYNQDGANGSLRLEYKL